MSKDATTPFEVRTRQVDLDSNDGRTNRCDLFGGGGVVGHRAAPDTEHNSGTGSGERWEFFMDPTLHAGALQPDSIDHALRRGVHTWGRIARPLVGRQRLDDNCTEARQIAVGRELATVARRARCGHDRISKRERANHDGHVGLTHRRWRTHRA